MVAALHSAGTMEDQTNSAAGIHTRTNMLTEQRRNQFCINHDNEEPEDGSDYALNILPTPHRRES